MRKKALIALLMAAGVAQATLVEDLVRTDDVVTTPEGDLRYLYATGTTNKTLIDAGQNGGRSIIVELGDNAVEAGNNLLAAYASAKSATPAPTDNNSMTLLLLNGEYDIGTNSLVLDTNYIHLQGLPFSTQIPQYDSLIENKSTSECGLISRIISSTTNGTVICDAILTMSYIRFQFLDIDNLSLGVGNMLYDRCYFTVSSIDEESDCQAHFYGCGFFQSGVCFATNASGGAEFSGVVKDSSFSELVEYSFGSGAAGTFSGQFWGVSSEDSDNSFAYLSANDVTGVIRESYLTGDNLFNVASNTLSFLNVNSSKIDSANFLKEAIVDSAIFRDSQFSATAFSGAVARTGFPLPVPNVFLGCEIPQSATNFITVISGCYDSDFNVVE